MFVRGRIAALLLSGILLAGCGSVYKETTTGIGSVKGTVSLGVPDELRCYGPGNDPESKCAIWSTANDAYAIAAGTSFATPYVSAAAGILIASGIPPTEVDRRLVASARSVAAGKDPFHYGAGLLDTSAALGISTQTTTSITTALAALRVPVSRNMHLAPSRTNVAAPQKAVARLRMRVDKEKRTYLRAKLEKHGYSIEDRGSIWIVEGGAELASLAQELQRARLVTGTRVSNTYRAFGLTYDPLVDQQWALPFTTFPSAWSGVFNLNRVVIAVLDTGIDMLHPDLKGTNWYAPCSLVDQSMVDKGDTTGLYPNGYVDLSPAEAFKSRSPDTFCWNNQPTDDVGHGTMVAGIIAATRGNGIGISGAGFGADNTTFRIMPVKVLDATGEGTDATVAYGIYYAVAQGANVINLSLGGTPGARPDPDVVEAVEYARQQGVVVVAAVGNQGEAAISPPANIPAVIAVGAVNIWGALADYSNYGTELDLVAPGGGAFTVNILASANGPDTDALLIKSATVTGKTGAFELPDIPIGNASYFWAWVDNDLNGLLNTGDYYDVVGPYQVQRNESLVVDMQLKRYTGRDILVH